MFSFISYSNLGLVTDRDGTDEIVKVELELHPDGTDNFDYLLNVDFKMEMKPEDKAVFNPNGNSFTPTNENCFLVFNVYEDDGSNGQQKASTVIRCEEVDMAISKLQFRANRAGSEALDEPSLALTYSIATI